ncbi:MAG TPA: hypothetical protein VL285_12530 [Bryobacteraceae bacterium]|nr:hypothetical protein [Bryobacteraceae bacterium]
MAWAALPPPRLERPLELPDAFPMGALHRKESGVDQNVIEEGAAGVSR